MWCMTGIVNVQQEMDITLLAQRHAHQNMHGWKDLPTRE